MAPVRRSGARRGEDPRRAGEREGRRRTGGRSGSTRATRTTTTRPRRSRARRACSAKGAHDHVRDLRRRLRDAGRAGGDQPRHARRSRRASAPTRWARSGSATKGKLAFSFGNVAQDEGSAMAEYAYRKGWRTAALATNTCLVYFKNVVQAFDKRFTQLGGKIVGRESYATGANNVNAAVSRLNARKADVIVTSTAFGELPALVSGLRSLGNKTPILNSWAGDGTYWKHEEPAGDELLRRHLRVGLRRRPEPGGARARASRSKAGTGGFVGGAARDRRRSRRRSSGRAARPTARSSPRRWRSSGRCRRSPGSSASRRSTTRVFGRQYRVIRIENNKAKLRRAR